jgi:hypothetical protein
MKINYDKRGLLIIGIVFILSIILNAIVHDLRLVYAIAFTMGVFSPYILFSVCYLIYCLIKYKEIHFFTDWRVVIFLIIFQLLSTIGTV